jgi:hypothetical protein
MTLKRLGSSIVLEMPKPIARHPEEALDPKIKKSSSPDFIF